ncbi:hypothetical protein FKM82_022140 [Ascaphus truei]
MFRMATCRFPVSGSSHHKVKGTHEFQQKCIVILRNSKCNANEKQKRHHSIFLCYLLTLFITVFPISSLSYISLRHPPEVFYLNDILV